MNYLVILFQRPKTMKTLLFSFYHDLVEIAKKITCALFSEIMMVFIQYTMLMGLRQ